MGKLILTLSEEIGEIFLNRQFKTLVNLSIVILIYGCSAIDSGKIATGYVDSYKAIRDYVLGSPDLNISREFIEDIPYASMLTRIGNGPQGLLILESRRNEDYIWVSADGVYLVIRRGKIIQTKGMFNNLMRVETTKENVFEKVVKTNKSLERIIYYSYDSPKLVNLKLKAEYRYAGKESISILGSNKTLNRIEETLTNSYLGWNVRNIYWVDEKQVVWKSEQFISPKLPKLTTLLTKKPS